MLVVSIVAAVITNVIIGMLWFSPALFGKVWAKENGIEMENGLDRARGTLITIISALIKVIVLIIFISMPRVKSFLDVLLVCVLIWLGFIVTVHMLELAWAGKKLKVFLIDIGHELVSTIAMATALFYIK
jgi:hypothetical protein